MARQCPECGNAMEEGQVYCTVCGWEFHMVPEFDPEVENQIDRTLSRLAGKIDGAEQAKQRVQERSSGETKRAGKQPKGKERRGVSAGKVFAVLVFVIAAAVLVFVVVHKTTADYLRLARKQIDAGNTAQAVRYLEEAREKEPGNTDVLFLLSEVYRDRGEYAESASVLKEITDSASYSDDETQRAYEALCAVFVQTKEYDRLEETLGRCPYASVTETYADFFPEAPAFSVAGGTYEGSVELALSSADGTVYYTLDGDSPGEKTLRYETPLVFDEEGTYHVRAVAINAQGVPGAEADETYEVEPVKIPEPRVFEDSGTYTRPTKIVVHAEEDLRIYYTTEEDAVPTTDDKEYAGPIQMPDGRSVFHFIAADEDGNVSETVTREYVLEVSRSVSQEQAVTNVRQALAQAGVSQAEAYTYVVDGTVTIGNDGEFYYIREYRVSPDGSREETGLLYAVNTQSGMTRRLGYDSYGQLILMQFVR